MDEAQLRSLQGYIGSVAHISQDQFVVTSPRGNSAVVIDAAGNVQNWYKSHDVCGVAATPRGETLMSNGGGTIFKLSTDGRLQIAQHDLAFDNHLVGLYV